MANDAQSGEAFVSDLKRVAAGIERLFYVSPFELHQLVRAIRDGDMNTSSRLLRQYVQDYLDRNGTSLELLGAEPLALLVSELVLRADCQGLKMSRLVAPRLTGG